MAKQESSALVDAAAGFADELAAYARLGELFVKTPLSSVKHLERANQLLADIAASEGKLQSAGQALVRVLTEARGEQETLAKSVVDHVPTVTARNERLKELMGELTGLATDVSGLNVQIASKNTGETAANPTPADARDLADVTLALSGRAEKLAETARDAEFEELATQAHSLHQKLQAIGKKLAKAGGN